MTAYEEGGRRGDIYTRVTLAVEETVKGTPAPQATIRVPGGEVNGLGLMVSDAASFTQGERVVVFLKSSDKGFEVYRQHRGKFTVEGEKVGEANKTLAAFLADISRAMGNPTVGPDESPPQTYEILTAPVALRTQGSTAAPNRAVVGNSLTGWQDLLNDGFEGGFPGSTWTLAVSSGKADAYWGKSNYLAHSGSYSVYCAANGTAAVDPASGYPPNMSGWMIAGPFDLSDATAAGPP